MEKITSIEGIAVPIAKSNIDTDIIMPKQYLKSIKRTGYGNFIFDGWRYLDEGDVGIDCNLRPKNPDFELNQERYQGAKLLLTLENFGCGSSREHAPWGLYEYGFRAIIAPSFADIFYNNCTKNGLLPVVLQAEECQALIQSTLDQTGHQLIVDLPDQCVRDGSHSYSFEIEAGVKHKLLNGLDDIATTLELKDKILHYELKRKATAPWIFQG